MCSKGLVATPNTTDHNLAVVPLLDNDGSAVAAVNAEVAPMMAVPVAFLSHAYTHATFTVTPLAVSHTFAAFAAITPAFTALAATLAPITFATFSTVTLAAFTALGARTLTRLTGLGL
jgi:hypothetical protein